MIALDTYYSNALECFPLADALITNNDLMNT